MKRMIVCLLLLASFGAVADVVFYQSGVEKYRIKVAAGVLQWLDPLGNLMATCTDAGTTGNWVFTGTVGATGGFTGVQPSAAALTAIAGLSSADSNIIVGSAGGWVAESGATARTSLGLGTGDSPSFTAVTAPTITSGVEDTTAGRVSIFGNATTTNPYLRFYPGGSYDATTNYWEVGPTALVGYEGDFVIMPANLSPNPSLLIDGATGAVTVPLFNASSGMNVGTGASGADDNEVVVGMADAGAYSLQGATAYTSGLASLNSANVATALNVGSTGSAADDNELCVGIADAGAYSLQGATLYTSGAGTIGTTLATGGAIVTTQNSTHEVLQMKRPLNTANAAQVVSTYMYNDANAYINYGFAGTAIEANGAGVESGYFIVYNRTAGVAAAEKFRVSSAGTGTFHGGVNVGSGASSADNNEVCIGVADVGAYGLQSTNAYLLYGFDVGGVNGADTGEVCAGIADAGAYSLQGVTVYTSGLATLNSVNVATALNVGSTGSAADDNELCVGIADAGAFSVQGASLYASGEVKSASANIGHAGDSADSGEIAVGTGDMGAYSVSCVSVYATGDVSALTFTDRASAYKGEDALTEILCVDHTSDDTFHQTLPEAVKRQVKTIKKEVPEGEAPILDPDTGKVTNAVEIEVTEAGWDLGETVSMLTAAVQQLEARNAALETRIAELEKKPK